MYITAVPFSLSNPRFEEYYEDFIHRALQAGVKRVFLCVSMCVADEADKRREEALLKKYLPKIEALGLQAGVWANSLGHGGTCEAECDGSNAAGLTLMKSLDGQAKGESYCPLDDRFAGLFCDWIQRLAAAGAKIIMLDDDYRMGFRDGGIYCCCDAHRRLLEAELGEPFDPALMKQSLLHGAPNRRRNAWLKVQGNVLIDFAAKLRSALDEVNPTVRLGHCAVLSTWDIDGADSLTLARAFAGKTKPFLRLIGAPYWAARHAFGEMRLEYTCEYERMQQGWAEGQGVEIFCEGDVFPRPRYTTPAAFLEGFDSAMRVAGTSDGILKYMFDYTSSPAFETGYYDRHLRDLPLYQKLAEHFDGKKAVGLQVFEPMRTLAASHEPAPNGQLEERCIPAALRFVCDCNLSVRYDAGEDPCVIFGDAAELATESLFTNGAVLDMAAAEILTRRGVDVGLLQIGAPFVPRIERYTGQNEVAGISGGKFSTVHLQESARVLSTLEQGNIVVPGAWFYCNAKGQRFLVEPFYAGQSYETGAQHGVLRCACRVKQLVEALPLLCGHLPEALCSTAPDVYFQAKSGPDTTGKKSLSCALWNFFEDDVPAPSVHLSESYTNIKFIAGGGSLQGDTVILDALPPYGCAAFTITK